MKKHFQKIILSTAIVSLALSNFSYAKAPVTLQVDGIKQELSVEPILVSDTTMVGMREVFEILGAKVTWNEQDKTIKAQKEEVTIQLNIGKTEAEVNGKKVSLSAEPRIIDGQTMVPLRFVSEALEASVDWDHENRVINVETKIDDQIQEDQFIQEEIVEKDLSSILWEENVEENSLTVEEAIEKALKNSYELKTLEEELYYLDEAIEKANNLVTATRPKDSLDQYQGGWQEAFITDKANRDALLGKIRAQVGKDVNKLEKELQEEVIKFTIQNYFDGITQLKQNIVLLQLSTEDLKRQLDIANSKFQVGMESEYNLNQLKTAYEQQEKSEESLRKSLDNLYIRLNRIMGIDESERMPLAYELKYEPIEKGNLNTHITKKINSDPTIKMREFDVQINKYSLQLYSYDQNSAAIDSYDIRKSNLNKAEYSLSNAKQQLKENIQTLYNEILQKEKEYEQKVLALEQAKKTLNVVKVQYQTGMALEADVKKAELGVIKAQVELNQVIIEHNQLKYKYEKPYLIS
jgi:hypothetical protein